MAPISALWLFGAAAILARADLAHKVRSHFLIGPDISCTLGQKDNADLEDFEAKVRRNTTHTT